MNGDAHDRAGRDTQVISFSSPRGRVSACFSSVPFSFFLVNNTALGITQGLVNFRIALSDVESKLAASGSLTFFEQA